MDIEMLDRVDADGRYEMMFYQMDKTRPGEYDNVMMYHIEYGWFIGFICVDEEETKIQENGINGLGRMFDMKDIYGWIALPELG